jgi:hypothetical protein
MALELGGEEKVVHKICSSCIKDGVETVMDCILSGCSVRGRGWEVKIICTGDKSWSFAYDWK